MLEWTGALTAAFCWIDSAGLEFWDGLTRRRLLHPTDR